MLDNSARIHIWQDQSSESTRLVVAAAIGGSEVHEIARHAGSSGVAETEEGLFREMADWLDNRGYDPPDHYWLRQYPG